MPDDVWQYRESMRLATQNVDIRGLEVVSGDGSPIGTVDEASDNGCRSAIGYH